MERNILIVDDDQHFSEAMRFLLGSDSYHTVWARDGREALQTLEQGHFHLVLTDLKMPGMDGFEMMDEIHRRYPFLSMIVVSAYGNPEVAFRAYKDGAAGFINKPFDAEYLQDIVSRSLTLQQPPDGKERRRHHRVQVSLPIVVEGTDARMINLSAGGLQMVTRERMSLFQICQLTIEMPEGAPVQCLAQIIRIERPEEHERRFSLAACRLRRLSSKDRIRLANFVQQVENYQVYGRLDGGGVH